MIRRLVLALIVLTFCACDAQGVPLVVDGGEPCGDAPGAPCCDPPAVQCAPGLYCYDPRGGGHAEVCKIQK